MRLSALGLVATAKRRAYRRIVNACGGDWQLADDLIALFVEGEPTLGDLRAVAAHAREVAAEIAAEEGAR